MIFWTKFAQKGYFQSKTEKNKNHNRTRHSQMRLGTKFLLKQTILNFRTIFVLWVEKSPNVKFRWDWFKKRCASLAIHDCNFRNKKIEKVKIIWGKFWKNLFQSATNRFSFLNFKIIITKHNKKLMIGGRHYCQCDRYYKV